MNFVKAQPGLVASIGVISIGSMYAVWKWHSKQQELPTEWQDVGVLSDLMCFPIKSCGVLRLPALECTQLGLQYDLLKDRQMMVISDSGNFVSARNEPTLILISPKIKGDELTLTAPNIEPFKIRLNELNQSPNHKTTLWKIPINALDCGDEAAKWISKYLRNEENGFRIVFFTDKMTNCRRSRMKSLISDINSGAFTDLTSFNLINESSVDDLNTRLKDISVDPQRFRPNFVVRGAEAYEEDHWQWVRIGEVVFKVIKYCTRCVLTTVDHTTGVKDKNREPLTTLKTYRMIGTEDYDKGSPIMGIHLILCKPGIVKVGDVISIVK